APPAPTPATPGRRGGPMSVLDRIVAYKKEEVARARLRQPEAALERRALAASPPRDFFLALRSGSGVRVIAEVKKASPSAGGVPGRLRPGGHRQGLPAARGSVRQRADRRTFVPG